MKPGQTQHDIGFRDIIRSLSSLLSLIFFLSLFTSCTDEIVPKPFYPRTDHEAYAYALELANLNGTALVKDWKKAAKYALEHPVQISSPFEETVYLDPSKAESIGYRFDVKRGQKVMIDVKAALPDSLKLFIDLYRINNDSLKDWKHVASADQYTYQLGFEPRRDAHYILRFQSELLRGGKFTISIKKVAALVFPVAGKNSQAIRSFFGDPRDGGRRDHHGVDIFAKRHTPIIAPTEGYIRRVDTTKLGGRVIWLFDSKRNQHLYFAHLEDQLVSRNTKVQPGDTIGTVGNTGNARRTPPHLHFGIYSRGPVNPFHFIAETSIDVEDLEADVELLGNWIRAKQKLFLKADLANETVLLDTLKQHDIMKVIGANTSFYKVQMPDNMIGYVHESKTEIVKQPILEIEGKQIIELLEAPKVTSLTKKRLNIGEQVSVLGKHKAYWYIKTSMGQIGWIRSIQ
ncbi:M23 family metallopeptidase [Fulvivirgaceae bacterium BMA10]|uniref:M23 family metallopeptidase n=1 Tax=Splendidivirga corallicola TaxID=3051826 RepID=A0ABT8KXN2_9BACT|nr:M23 family metallopeptidase [Fulvivirgaceae bacterium BMA10]